MQAEVEKLIANESIPFETKKQQLMELASYLLTTNTEMRRINAEIELTTEKKSSEQKKCRRELPK